MNQLSLNNNWLKFKTSGQSWIILPMSTPAHIVPEWYFLPVYAILRSIPNKLGGVAAIGLVFVSLFALPFINTSCVRSSSFRPIHQKLFWLLLQNIPQISKEN